ncbi:hypothetical protein [Alteraurantiacibacter buctensis]|uniref:Uncharacterized protein n=1 Tax=Alteraurantiacibacter buctensis TaxID=1503981 RepID=A0A844Z2L1_9SPHN|nr:hypothetical protein [Alteraurantiacibacter buctensis]MXO72727.1 hypothetical protein [Alteraurantiacibacter buctensis]
MTGKALAAAGALLALSATPAQADPARTVAESARQVEPARPVGALVPQTRIASSIELGRIMFPSGGGGALGAIIIAGNNDIPQRLADAALERAETRIAPLRTALAGFDATPLAGDATLAAVQATGWLGASPPDLLTVSADESADGTAHPVLVSRTYSIGLWGPSPNMNTAAETWAGDVGAMQRRFDEAHADAAERAQVQWRYQMSPDFSQVQVYADVSLRRQGVIEPYFAQQVISVVRLDRASYIEEDNVTRWAANDAALARRALAMAFARAGEVLPHVLALDQANFTALTEEEGRQTATAAGYHGPLLVRDTTGPVFWAEDGDQRLAAFVATQTIRE